MQTQTLSLHHIIRAPKAQSENSPVLFMFHGYGSNEEDLFSFASELPDELFIISVRAPQDLMPYGHAWYAIHFDAEDGKWSDDAQAIQSRELIANFIDEACYAVALSYPEKVKNIIALSGYVNQSIITEDYKDKDYTNISFYCSHGSVDQVIPVDWARKTAPFLEALQIKHIYEEFPVGHGVAPQNFYSLLNWLKERI